MWPQFGRPLHHRSKKTLKRLAPQAGLEPATLRLTEGHAHCYTESPIAIKCYGYKHFSHRLITT